MSGMTNLNNNSKKKIYIYGAGNFGSVLYSYLLMMDQDIEGFIVSDHNGNKDSLFGKRIISLNEYEKYKYKEDESIIYIAMQTIAAKQVEKILLDKKIHNYIIMDEIFRDRMGDDIVRKYDEDFHKKIQSSKILFQSYDGKNYSCNPKYISDRLLENGVNLDIVWTFRDIDHVIAPDNIRKVEIFSPRYFDELLTSKIIITNEAVVPFAAKRKGQYVINTWHGAGPLKKCGWDAVRNDAFLKATQIMADITDCFISAATFNSNFYKTAFHYYGKVLESGAPRNDLFFQENHCKKLICEKYNIDLSNRILIYTPTFRNNPNQESFHYYDIDFDRVVKALNDKFSAKFVCIYRGHYSIKKYLDKRQFAYPVIDASDYPDSQELLAAADVMISDYSSIMWDFSLQRKPVFLYHNDVDEYENDRGFYSDPKDWPYVIGHSNDELEEKIRTFDFKKYQSDLNIFLKVYGSLDDGKATDRVVDHIMKVINGE